MSNKFIQLWGLLLLLSPLFLTAQGPMLLGDGEEFQRCSSQNLLEIQMDQDPTVEERMQEIEKFTNEYLQTHQAEEKNGVITIPVVVHIVYRSSSQNISEAQILSQLDVLNEDFRRTNSDANNTWSQAADTEIEFCLASVDPDGNPTTGITRTSTKKRSFSYSTDGIKFASSGGHDAWPTDQYLNMWVGNLSNGLLGYAQFPGSGSADTDGVVMGYQYFGRAPQNPFASNFNLGRTATHEVGHWLNLRHIWGDGACSADDFVSDTPTSDAANYGCATGHVSCSSTDMVQNYMDYSDDACMNLFTQGQKSRMLALFAPGGARESLLSSGGCGGDTGGGGGPTASCNDGVQNGDETGVDCGGSCDPCAPTASCDDGVQNGNETGVDCGGSCDPCAPTGNCDAPTGLDASPFAGGKKATLSWNAVSGATEYTVELRIQGTSSWSTGSTSNTSMTANGLSKNSTYEWRVKADCSDYSGIDTFLAAPGGRLADAANVNVYPNPAKDFVVIEYLTESDAPLTVTLLDVTGKVVYQVVEGVDAYTEINTSDFANGVYFINLNNGSDLQSIHKLVINK